MPLYPTEKIIWDENIVPTEYYSGEGMISSSVNAANKKAALMSVFILSLELICSNLAYSSMLE